MTIASAITALAPWIYWKLDETSGTVAADSSGHGINGTISGDLQLGVSGPDIAGAALRLYTTGQVISAGLGLTAWNSYTMLFWATAPANGSPSLKTLAVSIGDPNNRFNRGVFLGQSSSSQDNLLWGIGGTSSSVSVSAGWPRPYWHLIGWFRDAVANQTGYSMDGGAWNTFGGTPGTVWQATDPLLVRSDAPVVIAHVAVFTQTLTNVQVQSVAAQVQPWPYQIGSNQIPASGGGTVDLTPVLTDTSQILANQTIFMPQTAQIPAIGTTTTDTNTKVNAIQTTTTNTHTDTQNIVNTLFPELSDFLNTIMGGITSSVVTAAGAISRTVGQMLSGREGDTLTEFDFGTTCDTTPATYELGGGLFYQARFTVTSMPDWYVLTGPGDTYITQSLGTLEFHRSGALLKRIGLHTTTHEEAPLPGIAAANLMNEFSVVPGDYQIVVYPAPGVCINTKAFHEP